MANAEDFNKYGFIHLKQVIPDNIIASLQNECNELLIKDNNINCNSLQSFIANNGCIIEPTFEMKNGLYLSSSYISYRNELKLNEIVSRFIVGKFIKNILKKLTDSQQIFLLNEQYIIKPSNTRNTEFVWHQDSNYLSQQNLYISVWIPIDNISKENGSIFMVPFDNALNINSWKIPSLLLKNEDIIKLQNKTNISIKDESEKKKEKNENDYNVKLPSFESKMIQLLPKIGDMIIFSSYTYHKSNSNISKKIRRVIMTQYSTFPIIDRINKKLARLVVKL